MTEGGIPPAPAAARGPTRAEAAASARRAVIEVAAIQLCGALALLLPRFRADRPEPLLGVLLAAVLLLWLAVAVAAAHQLAERGTSARVLLLIAVVLLGAGGALAVEALVLPGTSLALWLLVAGLPGVPLGTALSRAAARAVAPSTDAPGRWRPSPARRALAECWALLLAGSGAALLLGAGEVKALWIVPAVLVVCAAWLALVRLARRAAGLRGTGGRATALVLLVVAAAVAAIAAGAATGDAFWHLGGSLLGAVLLAALMPAAIVGALRAGAAARG